MGSPIAAMLGNAANLGGTSGVGTQSPELAEYCAANPQDTAMCPPQGQQQPQPGPTPTPGPPMAVRPDLPTAPDYAGVAEALQRSPELAGSGALQPSAEAGGQAYLGATPQTEALQAQSAATPTYGEGSPINASIQQLLQKLFGGGA